MSNMNYRRLGRLAIACSLNAIIALPALANTIHVPADQLTIQAGINAAFSGDTVLVAPGTYNEAINFNGKAITLASEAGANGTTIDATGLDASVITIPTAAGPSTVDGFTLTGGKGTDAGNGARLGGGINIQGGSVTIQNCGIVDNTAIGTTNPPSSFTSGRGGGIYAVGTQIVVRRCAVISNSAGGDCGGGRGGGCYITSTNAQIVECAIEENGASGGACAGTAQGEGGGIYLTSTSAAIVNSTINNNGVGGAGAGAAGIYVSTTSNTALINCSVSKNHATQCCSAPGPVSSGIFSGGTLTIHCSTIVGNTLGGVGGGLNPAGGVRASNNSVTISNSIVFGNAAAEIFGNALAVSDSCVEGGFAGANIIDEDPLFADLANGDYRLSDQSPCRDIGDLSTLPPDDDDLDGDGTTKEYVPVDLGGDRRIVNGFLDMGAFEWQHSCLADISPSSPGVAGDGAIDVDDLLAVINGWGKCDGCVADVNGDNSVDVDDLLSVINGWGGCN